MKTITVEGVTKDLTSNIGNGGVPAKNIQLDKEINLLFAYKNM